MVTRNLEQIYDIPTALRAFATIRGRFPNARLTVAGSGPLRDELERLAESLHIAEALRFTGRLDNEQLPDALPFRRSDAQSIDRRQHADLRPRSDGERRSDRKHRRRRGAVSGGRRLHRLARATAMPREDGNRGVRVLGEPALAARLRTAGIETAKGYAWTQVREKLFAVYARALGIPSLEPCSP